MGSAGTKSIADIDCIGFFIFIYDQVSVKPFGQRCPTYYQQSFATQISEMFSKPDMTFVRKSIPVFFVSIIGKNTIIRRIQKHKIIFSSHLEYILIIRIEYFRSSKQPTIFFC